MPRPHLIFGTATFGMPLTAQQDASSVGEVLSLLKDNNITHLDSGARYPPNAPGRSETLLGENVDIAKQLIVDTKILIGAEPNGHLTSQNIDKSMRESLERLKMAQVHTLYAHAADPQTPLEEQIRGFNAQIQNGRCQEWGVSNHSVAVVREILQICDDKQLIKPAVFQGEYNIITRGVENELLPLLRQHGMRFAGFRPLAGGFLTGSAFARDPEQIAGTRFSKEHPFGEGMRAVFGGEELAAAVKKFVSECDKRRIKAIEVALRWLL